MSGARSKALRVACPKCSVAAGVACLGRAGPRTAVHKERITAAAAEVAIFSRRSGGRVRADRCNTQGTIYVIEGAAGLYKIGFTAGPVGKRLRALQTGNPVKLRIEMTLTGTQREEQRLHALFADKRSVGEWFELSALDLAVLRHGG